MCEMRAHGQLCCLTSEMRNCIHFGTGFGVGCVFVPFTCRTLLSRDDGNWHKTIIFSCDIYCICVWTSLLRHQREIITVLIAARWPNCKIQSQMIRIMGSPPSTHTHTRIHRHSAQLLNSPCPPLINAYVMGILLSVDKWQRPTA